MEPSRGKIPCYTAELPVLEPTAPASPARRITRPRFLYGALMALGLGALVFVAVRVRTGGDAAPVIDLTPGHSVVDRLSANAAQRVRFRVPPHSWVELVAQQRGQDVTLALQRRAKGTRFVDATDASTGTESLALVTGDASEELTVDVALAWPTAAAAAHGGYRLALSVRPRLSEDTARARAWEMVERAEAALRDGHGEALAAARRDGLEAAAQSNDQALRSRALFTAGSAAARFGDRDVAAALLTRALEAASRSGDPSAVLRSELALASTLLGSQAELTRGEELARNGAERARQLGDDRLRAEALAVSLWLAMERSTTSATAASIASLDEIAHRIGDPLLEARASWLAGAIAYDIGDERTAFARLERSIAELRTLGPRGERDLSEALHNLASCLTKFRAAFAQSVPVAEEAVELAGRTGYRDNEAGSLGQLASALRKLGQLEKSRATWERSLVLQRAVHSVVGEAYALEGLGLVLRELGDHAGAVTRLEQSLEVLADGAYPSYEARAHYFLASVHEERGQLDDARAAAQQAVAISERSRCELDSETHRTHFSASTRRYYEQLLRLELTLANARPSERETYLAAALDVSEKAHARTLLEATGAPSEAACQAPPALDVGALRARLARRDAAVVEYFLGEQASYGFVLWRDGLDAFRLPSRAELEARVEQALDDLSLRTRSTPDVPIHDRRQQVAAADERWNDASRALGEQLLGPATPALTPGAPLWIVADGALQGLPFAALTLPGENEPAVVRTELTMAPSLALATTKRMQPARWPPRVLVVADPVFSPEDERVVELPTAPAQARGAASLSRLFFTRAEADAIAAAAPPARTTVLLGFDATRERLLPPASTPYDLLHIASHFRMDPEEPEKSGVVLSGFDGGGRRRDGFLSLADVERPGLHAELVVLSGCESGVGRAAPSEGMLSLARGFLHAGVHHVVSTQLPVDDRATSALMGHFYRAYLKERRAPAAALRTAQLAMAQGEWSAPYYWSGFLVSSVAVE